MKRKKTLKYKKNIDIYAKYNAIKMGLVRCNMSKKQMNEKIGLKYEDNNDFAVHHSFNKFEEFFVQINGIFIKQYGFSVVPYANQIKKDKQKRGGNRG